MGWRCSETFFYNGKSSRKLYFPAIKEAQTALLVNNKKEIGEFQAGKAYFCKKYLK